MRATSRWNPRRSTSRFASWLDRALGGSTAELLVRLNSMVSDGIRRSTRWPKGAQRTRRMASNLRSAGIELNSSRADRLGRRILSVSCATSITEKIVSYRQCADRGLAHKFPGRRPTARQPYRAVGGARFFPATTTPLTMTDDDLQSWRSCPARQARPTTSESLKRVLEY